MTAAMSQALPDDPFAAAGTHTFSLPTPGTRGTVASRRWVKTASDEVAPDIVVPESGLNPLLAVANPLIALLVQLSRTEHVVDADALKESIAHAVRDFELRARTRGIAMERVRAARYILCTALDEAAAWTPWGGAGRWGQDNLLVRFHNEADGGKKVFELMARLAQDPAANRELLELTYAVINLGFQGQYRLVPGGHSQLDAVRGRLAQVLQRARGDHPVPLAQNWRVLRRQRSGSLSWLPLSVCGALAALLLVAVALGFSLSLGSRSDPVFAEIQGLRLAPPLSATPQPAATPRLAQFLQGDIKAGHVSVRDDVDRSVVTVRGDGLFAPGSATLVPEREALMRRIAQALERVPGSVLVTGHTDSQPIRSLRFPSNWHLSQERANAVRDLLAGTGVAADRLRAEGRADSEPLSDNETAVDRARNRRVEIALLLGRDGAGARPPARGRGASGVNP